jgi:uncharacterized protein YndB with AHSA1/START domain
VKIALYVVLGLVGVVALVAVIGLALPKGHRATRTVHLTASPAAVFAAIAEVEKYAEWRSDVARVERLPDDQGRVVFREHGKHGPITFRIDESIPPTRMLTRIADPGLPFGGTWTYDLKPADSGTDLTITEDGEVRNPIFRFMSRFFFSQTATIEAYQAALQRRLAAAGRPQG